MWRGGLNTKANKTIDARNRTRCPQPRKHVPDSVHGMPHRHWQRYSDQGVFRQPPLDKGSWRTPKRYCRATHALPVSYPSAHLEQSLELMTCSPHPRTQQTKASHSALHRRSSHALPAAQHLLSLQCITQTQTGINNTRKQKPHACNIRRQLAYQTCIHEQQLRLPLSCCQQARMMSARAQQT